MAWPKYFLSAIAFLDRFIDLQSLIDNETHRPAQVPELCPVLWAAYKRLRMTIASTR